MSFEALTLTPTSGSVDVKRVGKWLDSASYVFRDAEHPSAWHICSSARRAALSRVYGANSPYDVVVWIDPSTVRLSAFADVQALGHAREFIKWLLGHGSWMATIDRAKPVLVHDPDDLFRDLPRVISEVMDDLTCDPVTDGVLTSIGAGHQHLHVHSSGEVRFEAPGRTLRSHLTVQALAHWNAAVASADPNDPLLQQDLPEGTALLLEVATIEGSEFASFDSAAPPPSFENLARIVTEWFHFLDTWVPGDLHEDFLDVHEDSHNPGLAGAMYDGE